MAEEKRFVVKKDAKTDVITYMEYERLKGFNVKPKKNVSFEDMINVESMILINPSLIEKLISMNKINKLEKPKIETFDYYPYELLINYSYLTRMTSKHSSSEIAKIHYEAINHDKIVNGLFGIDVKTEINNPSEYDDEFDDNTRVFQFYPIFILSTLHDYYDKREYKELVAYMNVQWTNNNEITRDKTIVK